MATQAQRHGSNVFTVRKTYDAAGRVATLTYPSGKVVTYSYTNGQVSSVTLDGVAIANNISHTPFGAVQSWTWGSGTAHTRSFDLNGRMTGHPLGADQRTIAYDDAARITAVTHVPTTSLDQSFGYDNLDRLTQANSSTTGRTWGYDLTGNRTQASVGGATDTYSTAATSNRLNTITGGVARTFSYDAMGNITGDGTFTATYDARGRLKSVTKAGSTTSYDYDGFGQRIKKSGGPAGTVFYVYDTDGKLLGEYNGSVVAVNEYVWLGDMPLAVLTRSETLRDDTAGGGTVNFLGTWTAGVTTAYGYYGSNYHTHAAQAASSETVTWNLSLATGTYKVYARWPASTTHSAQALYQVIHASGTTNVTVNQKLDGGEWVLLGTFSMTSANSKVVLTPQPDGIVAADAVKAVDTSEASRIFYVHADHLNAPRAVMNSANQLRWRWTSDPFGLVPPEDNPAGLGTFTLNPRLPGQLYDIESNLHYNYFRDYDPSTGRYAQSDPIGLRGGVNTYVYAAADPTSRIDPRGLTYTWTQSGNTVTIHITITAYGESASEALAQSWQTGISEYWNNNGKNFTYGRCTVAFDVKVTADPGSKWWFGAAKADNYINVMPDPYRSWSLIGGPYGRWSMGAGGWEAAHESGHLFGLPDDYTDLNSPKPGHAGHMMAQPNKPVVQHEIDDILRQIKCQCDN